MTSGVLAATSSSLSNVEPGVLAFLIVAGIGVVLVFLLRSMNKQFRKIGPPPEDTEAQGASESASERPLRGLAAHRAAMAAAETKADAGSAAERTDAERD